MIFNHYDNFSNISDIINENDLIIKILKFLKIN